MTIELDGLPECREFFKELTDRIEHPDIAFNRSETLMYSAMNSRFQSAGPGWVDRKNEQRYTWPKLLKTGSLRDHVTGGGIHRRRFGKQRSEMEIGTSVFYAKYQQDGTFDRSTSPNRKGIAPRPFVYYDEDNMNDIEDIFVDFLFVW